MRWYVKSQIGVRNEAGRKRHPAKPRSEEAYVSIGLIAYGIGMRQRNGAVGRTDSHRSATVAIVEPRQLMIRMNNMYI